jgi:alanine racemase
LRESRIEAPILVLSAMLPGEAEAAVAGELMPTLFTVELARALSEAARKRRRVARAHFKIDTGMGRLGVNWREAGEVWREIAALPHLNVEGVFTHFASAEDGVDEANLDQLRRFANALRTCRLEPGQVLLHAANSAGALRYKSARFDLSRTGVALWGVAPGEEDDVPLRPVMHWKALVTSVKTLRKGETVSYGATWRASRRSQIVTVPVGYADGFPRSLSNVGMVLLRGQRLPVVGRVTMDQVLVDATDLSPQVEIGEPVTLWGEEKSATTQGLRVEELATRAGTIAYELLCGVAARVPRLYLQEPCESGREP